MRKLAPFVLFGIILFTSRHIVKPVLVHGAKGAVKTVKVAKKVLI